VILFVGTLTDTGHNYTFHLYGFMSFSKAQLTSQYKVSVGGEHHLLVKHIALVSLVCLGMYLWAHNVSSEEPASPQQLIGVSDFWCPYVCNQQPGMPGYMVELLREALKPQDQDFKLEVAPWARALRIANTKKEYALVGISELRKGRLLTNRIPIGLDETVVISTKDRKLVFENMSSLDGYHIGYVKMSDKALGSDLHQYLLSREQQNYAKVSTISGNEPVNQLVKMLMSNHIDAIIGNRHVAQFEALRLNFSDSIDVVGSVGHVFLYMAINPDFPGAQQLIDAVDKELLVMLQDGRFRKILAAYGVDDWDLKAAPH